MRRPGLRVTGASLWLSASSLLSLMPVLVVPVLVTLVTPGCASRIGPARDATVSVQLLAFNDLHGHLAANTPGAIEIGCCEAARSRAGQQVGWAPRVQRAGGVEYLATHLAALRAGKRYSYTVAAGDLIGGSPMLSGLFHDEPTIEAMKILGLEVSAVGNHEFDEGVGELLRIQGGRRPEATGCHPVDGCQDGTPFDGASFQYLAANVRREGSRQTILPASAVRDVSGIKLAFIGLTLRDTPSIVTPRGVAGLTFGDEVEAANAEVARLRRTGVRAFVVLLHQGGEQQPLDPVFPGPAEQPEAFTDVNGCARFRGPEIDAIARGLDSDIKVLVTGHSHEPYVCRHEGKLVTSAASFGRVVTNIAMNLDRRSGEIINASATNHVVTQDVDREPRVTAMVGRYAAAMAPMAGRIVGRIAADIPSDREAPSGLNAAGEQPMGDVVADAMLAAASSLQGDGAVAAFTNEGGIRSGLSFARTTSGEQPGEVTYEELFAVQPFGNALVVLDCSGDDLYQVLEQQFDNPSPGANRVMPVSATVRYRWHGTPSPRVLEGSLTIAGQAVDRGRRYRVVVNAFLADGGDRFTVFKDRCTAVRGAGMDIDALGAYVAAQSPLTPPALERIEKVD